MHVNALILYHKINEKKIKKQTAVALHRNKHTIYTIGFESLIDIRKNRDLEESLFFLARLEGFEPPTSAFVVRYSIQLS